MSHHHRERYRLDFPALMAQCEENYARMMQLLRMLGEQPHATVSVSFGSVPSSSVSSADKDRRLWVRVLEKAPYTTILQLEQDALHPMMQASALTVRLYHDARIAEVTEARPWRKVAAKNVYPNAAMHMPDEKHQWNSFLGEWLRHVATNGCALTPIN